ncbi:MAG: hypothetical protein JOZ50_03070, partial [Candidatus Eremiobacteraeota bacterium]|nr:hypothetical protein [Candidatus Eremiobacteraeota bacterium]
TGAKPRGADDGVAVAAGVAWLVGAGGGCGPAMAREDTMLQPAALILTTIHDLRTMLRTPFA